MILSCYSQLIPEHNVSHENSCEDYFSLFNRRNIPNVVVLTEEIIQNIACIQYMH